LLVDDKPSLRTAMKSTVDRAPLRDQPVSAVHPSRRKIPLIHRHSPLHRRREFPSQDTNPLAMEPNTALPSAPAGDPLRVLARLPVVLKMTGLGRSTIYRWVADGSFPPPVRLGPRAVAWRWSDLDRWTRSRDTAQH
jgi:prophage regulatory protein